MSNSAIRNNSLVLGLFAVITAALLATTNMGTKDRIAEEERRVAERALLELIPKDRHDNDLISDTLDIPSRFLATLGVKPEQHINVARINNQPVAFIVPSIAPDGYSGDISIITGINVDGTLAGVRIVSHKETPGLGDKVDTNKSDWVFSFNGASLNKPKRENWAVKKDGGTFDQFTGATITPRAVVNQVKATLIYFEEDRERLLKQAELSQTNKQGADHE